jgi:ATP-dependent Clp protease protease subunit
MIHQPHISGLEGQATDIEIHAREIIRIKTEINELLGRHTGKSVDSIKADTERDFWMTASEALDYGLVDEVLAGRTLEAVAG